MGRDDVRFGLRGPECGYCSRTYRTEDEARQCAQICKSFFNKNLTGKIIAWNRGSETHVAVIQGGKIDERYWPCISVSKGESFVHVIGKGAFDPLLLRDLCCRELTVEEFKECLESVKSAANEEIDDLIGVTESGSLFSPR